MRVRLLSANQQLECPEPAELPEIETYEPGWLHITTNNEFKLETALAPFRIHPLTIEDIMNPMTRIKKEKFEHYVFFIFRAFRLEGHTLQALNFYFILLNRLVITITVDDRNTIDDLWKNADIARGLLQRGPEYLVHRILDTETDRVMAIIHQLEDRVDFFEDSVYMEDLEIPITEVFNYKGILQHIKRAILSHREIFENLMRIDGFDPDALVFFRDVNDHSIRIIEGVDSIVESISSAIEAYMALSTRRTNEVVKILTTLTAILLPVSLIAGIYGMNFEFIPGGRSPYGFALTVGGMGLLGAGLFYVFRRLKWI
ncbi:MAG: magnesium transporter CorA family protein [Leptospirales bacterium]|nr:magnesium transporter CorA family protein [Leptospirales bacterium]